MNQKWREIGYNILVCQAAVEHALAKRQTMEPLRGRLSEESTDQLIVRLVHLSQGRQTIGAYECSFVTRTERGLVECVPAKRGQRY